MNISIETGLDEPAPTHILPVFLTDDLADFLAALADEVNVPADVMQRDFKAEAGEVLPLYGPDGLKIYLLGLGKTPRPADVVLAFRKLFFTQKSRLPAYVSIDTHNLGSEAFVTAVVLGVRAGGYDLKLYQTDKPDGPVFYGETGELSLVIDENDLETAEVGLIYAEALAQTQREMRDLMNAPASHKTPQTLADWAVASGQKNGYSVTVFDRAEMEKQGLLAVLSVNNGSDVPPAFIIMDYQPTGVENPKTVGLVGKGITFDTGGISIKQSANMHLMKSDMGGAAAVMGAVEVAAKIGLPVRVIGIVPSTENMVDGKATKPGDVIGSYIGKTIEVIDTDAEGRIILADGLGYMVRNYQPHVLIDLATLTGSVIGALGYQAAGLFTQNDELAAQLIQSADATGERLWRLPLWDAYKDDIKSDVADLKNFSGKPFAGAISAAKFLEVFTENHPAWAHLDIAGMAFGDTEFGSQKNATAFGIHLLVDFLKLIES